ncbi:MAG: MurR/RpiR family transcriptional regulator [Thermodesulfobacteriota bacterium]
MTNSAKSELYERIARVYPRLSPKKRRLADFIVNDYKNLFLTTAKELAQRCQVSEPTVMRFVMDLGFSGYAEFEQYVKGLLHIELTSVERLLRTQPNSRRPGALEAHVHNAIQNLEKMAGAISDQEIGHLAQIIYSAPSVIVAGYRASATLAYYFGFLLKKIRDQVTMDTACSPEVLDQIAAAAEPVLLMVLSFPRYPRRIIELMQYARHYQVQILGVSDTPKSPIASLSDHFVIIDVEGLSFVDPFAHIITFLGTLIHEIAFIDKAATVKRLSKIEDGVKRRQEFFTEFERRPDSQDPLELGYYIKSKPTPSQEGGPG